MGEIKISYKIIFGSISLSKHIRNPCLYERILLKWILKKYDLIWAGFDWCRTGPLAGSCEKVSEHLGCMK
jgi:hypothetical protein